MPAREPSASENTTAAVPAPAWMTMLWWVAVVLLLVSTFCILRALLFIQ
jgi:hypothetical protein